MRVLAFGTYDAKAHPRIQVLIDGLRAHGAEVVELVEPLGLSTSDRVEILQHARHIPAFLGRIVRRWAALVAGARRFRGPARPTHVLVGYLGHFDVLLARVLFPRATVILDHLVFADDTARDRGAGEGWRTRLLTALDRLALAAADVVVTDTAEHLDMVPAAHRRKGVVAPVGATRPWFDAGERARGVARTETPLSVIFFGTFTPLQGTPVVARALRQLRDRGVDLRVTLVGSGQDAQDVREVLDGQGNITWLEWVDGDRLPELVASHDVCLGIFGLSQKAARVVPNKVYQGAAAGCAVVTSDTPAQRRALGEDAVLVAPGDPDALAEALGVLARTPGRVAALRAAAARRAQDFAASVVVRDLMEDLR